MAQIFNSCPWMFQQNKCDYFISYFIDSNCYERAKPTETKAMHCKWS